jgi:hypothetical protein
MSSSVEDWHKNRMNCSRLYPMVSACPEGIKEKKTWQSFSLWHKRDLHHDPISGNKSHKLNFYNITLSASWNFRPLSCQWLPTHGVHIYIYIGLDACRGLLVDSSQPTVSCNTLEVHSQTQDGGQVPVLSGQYVAHCMNVMDLSHDGGECLCWLGNTWYTAWTYRTYGASYAPKTYIKAITRVHPTFTFQCPVTTKELEVFWNHGTTARRLVKHKFHKFTWRQCASSLYNCRSRMRVGTVLMNANRYGTSMMTSITTTGIW